MYRGGSKGKDLTGKRFSSLVVEKYLFTGDHGKVYLCQCDCGNKTEYRGATLTSGKIQACGCRIGKSNKGRRYPQLATKRIGEKHHFLTITGIEPTVIIKQRGYVMVCKCDCGNITRQVYSDIKNGKVKSCGCYQKEQASKWGSINGLNNSTRRCGKLKWAYNGIRMKSGYEVMYAIWLDRQDIRWKYEPKYFILKKGMRYTPDFYLPQTNEWIETKGFLKQSSIEKMKVFRKLGHSLKMIEIKELNNLFGCCYHTFRKRWNKGEYKI